MSTPPTTALASAETRPVSRVGGLPRVEASGPLGVVTELMRDQYGALLRWQQDYGGVFEIKVGPTTFVIAADANTASEMLIDGGQTFVRGGAMYSPMEPLFGESMLTSEGELWRSRRRGAQPHFRQRAVAKMGERVNSTLEEVLAELEPGPFDANQFGGRLSMSVGLAVMFGHGLSRPGFEELGAAVDFAVAHIATGWVTHKLPRWIPVPGRRHYRRAIEVIDRVVHELIAERRQSGEFGDDLLGMLLHMAAGGEWSNQAVRNEAVALIVAGYETTATAVAWALHELARKPEFLARVRAEADAVLDADPPRNPKALAYTRQVFMETLRKYPSATWIPRNATENASLAGYPIPAGTAVLCSPYLVHHDPHAWVDPERFDPDRFAEGSDQPRNRHAFMPFGLGQHMCIGQHLALLEGPLALARLARRWDLAPIPGREPEIRISTTMEVKDGIWLELSPRAT
jgi:cytochrome P450